MNWNLPVDYRVVIFTFGFALAAGLAFGVVPALRGSRPDLVGALKEGARGSQSNGRFGLRGVLVVLQVAVCAVLLVGAALLARSARSATEIDLGFDPRGLLGVALFPVRFGAAMLMGTGIVALLLVSVGLYGVIAYSVAGRAQEIGIRMALGATGSKVLRMVLRRGMALVVFGAIIGVAGAAVLGRSLGSILYGVSPLDPIAFAGAFLVLAVVATLANWFPARRAAMLDPIDTLRSE